MDGKELLYSLRQNLDEDANSTFLDAKTSYKFLWQAAKEFVRRTKCLRASQSITTVASQAGYDLNADFMELIIRDRDKNYVVKYNDGSDTFIKERSYEDITYMNNTTSVSRPESFAIIDSPSLGAAISSTATAAGAATGGKCTLTDSATTFSSSVGAGDSVHNLTDGSDGIVLSVSTNSVEVALFGGTNNDVTSGDSYIIQPQGRLKLVLSPPPSTAGHTVTVEYLQVPAPVFSSYGVYRIQEQWHEHLASYAAWMYKYKDREPNFGDRLYSYFNSGVSRAVNSYKRSMSSNDLHVSFRKG